MVHIMGCERLFLLAAVWLAAVGWPAMADTGDVRYGFSAEGRYCARVCESSSGDEHAHIQLLAYDPATRAFGNVCSTQLPYWHVPLRILVSHDGRYVVALGKNGGAGDDLRNEIWIWDTRRNISRSIDLSEIFSEDELDKYASRFHMLPGIFWFADETDGLPPVFDRHSKKLYVTVGVNSFSLGSGYKKRIVSRYSMERPTVVIDLEALRASTEKTTEVSEWKERYDKAVLRQRLFDELLRSYLADRRHVYVARLLKQSLQSPRVELKSAGRSWLFRLEPGNDQRSARILVLKYTEDKNGFVCVRELVTPNSVAPAEWRVSHDACYIVTLDDINAIGVSPNSVVVYHVHDGKKKAFSVANLLSKRELSELVVRRSLIAWRSGIWNMDQVDDGTPAIMINRFGPSHLPRVIVYLEKMEVRVAHDGETAKRVQ